MGCLKSLSKMKPRGLEVSSELNIGNSAATELPDSHAGVYRCKPLINVCNWNRNDKNKEEVAKGIACVKGGISFCLLMDETLWALSRQHSELHFSLWHTHTHTHTHIQRLERHRSTTEEKIGCDQIIKGSSTMNIHTGAEKGNFSLGFF